MPTIHIYNPETDYALASFSPFYTPPASVIEVRKRLAFLPTEFASPGDIILTLDDISAPPNIPENLIHLSLSDLPDYLQSFKFSDPAVAENFTILPWGWNPALKQTLLAEGVPESMLPSDSFLKNLRNISHRRLTIDFNNLFKSLTTESEKHRFLTHSPIEFTNVKDALKWQQENQPVFFKAPWSSSGRGILFTEDLEEKHIKPWLSGIIKRQGSVLGEIAENKCVDFATEWLIKRDSNGKPLATFLGYSAFEASKRGKYHFNINGAPHDIIGFIESTGVKLNPELIKKQKYCLETLCGDYTGYCGIDMLADSSGRVKPIVEINWRLTMGIVNLLSNL